MGYGKNEFNSEWGYLEGRLRSIGDLFAGAHGNESTGLHGGRHLYVSSALSGDNKVHLVRVALNKVRMSGGYRFISRVVFVSEQNETSDRSLPDMEVGGNLFDWGHKTHWEAIQLPFRPVKAAFFFRGHDGTWRDIERAFGKVLEIFRE